MPLQILRNEITKMETDAIVNDGEGLELCYAAVAETVCNLRRCKPIAANWSEAIHADSQKRNKQR